MPRRKAIQSVKGMHDILPEEQPWWEFIIKKSKPILEEYDFKKIDTPILENIELFERSIGPGTDIVEKEMYSLRTKGGDRLVLRPEGTAPIVRAYVEHGMHSLPQPVKLYYFGPMFRHEQPQAGRLRQFWQLGLELIGDDSYSSDAEIIFILWKIFEEIGLKDLTLQINSIGDGNCRPAYKKALKDFYRSKLKKVCSSCRTKFKKNILRMLDCNQPQCQEISNQAPQIVDYLDDECKEHFKNVLEFLDELNVPYILNPRLVRGLDYYAKTVFEIWPEEITDEEPQISTQIALAGGGRYNKLVELLGGPKIEGTGWSMGIERIINLLKNKKIKMPSSRSKPKIFLAQLGDLAKKKSMLLFEQFRKAGIPIEASFGRNSIKSQLRIANRIGVRFTLILGQREALDGNVILRDMESSIQETIPLEEIVQVVKKRLKE